LQQNPFTCALHRQLQAMPVAGADLLVRPGELFAIALHAFVEPDVVLQGIGTSDVVVLLILETRYQSGGLVHPSDTRVCRDMFAY
jgi:hypothetical protein